MKVLNLYYSLTGNTKSYAETIEGVLRGSGHAFDTLQAEKTLVVDLLSYDFVFAGSGVYQWLPGKPMLDFLRETRRRYAEAGNILPCAPRLPGKKAVIYCTYAGVHTGNAEAVPAVKFTGQLFDHLGFTVIDEWYFIGDFRQESFEHMNIGGRFGDITGRPSRPELEEAAQRIKAVITV